MLIGSLVDTIMNLTTFAFIGACVWLLMRDLPERGEEGSGPDDESAG